MDWNEVRKQYKDTWLLIEALDGKTIDGYRVIHDVEVIDNSSDSSEIVKRYKEVRRKDSSKEYCYVFSGWDELKFEEMWSGVRMGLKNENQAN